MAAEPTLDVDARLQAVLARAAAGQPLTVAMIGGSITTGYAAHPPRECGWAAQVATWLGQRTQVSCVNAGVSGTDSAAAVHRVQAHVLDHTPDLVFVEFGVNDEWLEPAVRTASYEALLRRLLAAPQRPAVVTLHLTQQHNQPRGAVEQHLAIARRLGLTAIDFGSRFQGDWTPLYNEPVHPNPVGHERIAQAVIETLEQAARAPLGTERPLPPPADRRWEFTRLIEGAALQPWRNRGFVRGGEVHPEWPGQQPGWVARSDDAQASFLVWGTDVAVFHAESKNDRNLEAWVDDGPVVTLRGHVPERDGYLGWKHVTVGRGLEPGAHLLHVRMKRDDGFAGSGRPASLLSVMATGVLPPALVPTDFDAVASAPGRFVRHDDPQLRWVGRFERQPSRRLLAWSGSELRARFSGPQLAVRMAPALGGRAWYTVEIDGRPHVLAPNGQGTRDWVLRTPLSAGEHELRIVKRTEAPMAETWFEGLVLAPDGELLTPPPPRPLRLDFYGDSITAGACNGDPNADQYEDFSTHDGTRAYGALAAQQLGADYRGFAISGTGITATWSEVLMPQVWDRTAARRDAPQAEDDPDVRPPDVVLVNLGQNDHGFPNSRGEPLAADFGQRYLAFVRTLRTRHPQARLVLLIGGMTAWKDQPALPKALDDAVHQMRAAGDTRIWRYTFEAFAFAHPRIDVHSRMADELVAFLNNEVLK